jgi:hypothetical protein
MLGQIRSHCCTAKLISISGGRGEKNEQLSLGMAHTIIRKRSFPLKKARESCLVWSGFTIIFKGILTDQNLKDKARP